MNCAEAKSLIPLLALDALEDEERAALDARLLDCEHCRKEADVARAAYDLLETATEAELEPLSDGVREKLMAEVHRDGFSVVEDVADGAAKKKGIVASAADPAKVEAAAQRISLSCIYCHGSVKREELVFCAGCLAPHHDDCFEAETVCSAPGCDSTLTVRPGQQEPKFFGAVGKRRGFFLVAALGGVAALAGITGAAVAFSDQLRSPQYDATVEHQRDMQRLKEEKDKLKDQLADLQEPPPSEDPDAWKEPFRADTQRLVATLKMEVLREDRELITCAIEDIGKRCRQEMFAKRAYPREVRSEVRAVFTAAHKAFPPRPRVMARMVPATERQRINVNVQGGGEDLAEVMEGIGRQVGVNILVDPNVQETVMISLRDIAWREAVGVIARMTRCEVEERPGGILLLTQPPKTTMSFDDANIRFVMKELAKLSGKNIVISEGVQGKVTVTFKEVHWLRALHSLASANNLVLIEETEDLLLVMTQRAFDDRQDEPVDIEKSVKRLMARMGDGKPPVNLTLSRKPLSEVVFAINDQAGCNVLIDTPRSYVLTVDMKKAPWRRALDEIALATGLEVVKSKKGPVLREVRHTQISAWQAPLDVFLQALGQAGRFDVTVVPVEGGPKTLVTAGLKGAACATVAEAIAETSGWEPEWKEGKLVVKPNAKTGGDPYKPAALQLRGGKWVKLRLQAIILAEETKTSLVIIDGRIHEVGDVLHNVLEITKINRSGALVRERGTKRVQLLMPGTDRR